MNTTAPYKVYSLLWVEVTVPNQPTYYARTSRLLADTSESEYAHTIELLKAGKPITYEASGICIQCVPIVGSDKKRLDHLLTFEADGFRLATFRGNQALFYKGEQEYCSMNELAERGFTPNPAIASAQCNTPIVNIRGQLRDVFVPIQLLAIYFERPCAIQ